MLQTPILKVPCVYKASTIMFILFLSVGYCLIHMFWLGAWLVLLPATWLGIWFTKSLFLNSVLCFFFDHDSVCVGTFTLDLQLPVVVSYHIIILWFPNPLAGVVDKSCMLLTWLYILKEYCHQRIMIKEELKEKG